MQNFAHWLMHFKEFSSSKALAIKNRVVDISQRSGDIFSGKQTILECVTHISYLKARQVVLQNSDLLAITKHEKHALELYGDYLEFRELSNYQFPTEQPSMLEEYCASMAMSYSYKPVLISTLVAKMDANGGCTLDELSQEIRAYYQRRRQQGLISERSNSLFSHELSLDEAKLIIIQNPVKALVGAGVLVRSGNQNRISFSPSYLPTSASCIEAVRNICTERLEAYYRKISDTVTAINADNVYPRMMELIMQVHDTQLRSQILECFEFVYKAQKDSVGDSRLHKDIHPQIPSTISQHSLPEPLTDPDERKVGKLIKDSMLALSDAGYCFTDEQLLDLQSAAWSKRTLGVYYPMFKAYNDHETLGVQRVDHLGNGRYWNQVFIFSGKKFLITSEWYKQSRQLFIQWYNSLLKKE